MTELEKFYRNLISSAIERRRHIIIHEISRMLGPALDGAENVDRLVASEMPEDDWVPIESLSQLRGLVGGRFKNLKDRWLAAGFPLREHRGDREQEASINQEGWLELVVWLNRQGFEARLPASESSHLIELRKFNLEN